MDESGRSSAAIGVAATGSLLWDERKVHEKKQIDQSKSEEEILDYGQSMSAYSVSGSAGVSVVVASVASSITESAVCVGVSVVAGDGCLNCRERGLRAGLEGPTRASI